MDSRTRSLWRGLVSDGSLVSVIVDIIRSLDPSSIEAKEINRYLTFYADRISYKWRLGTEKQFSICHLGDDTIRRLIEMPMARRIQEHWVRRGMDKEQSGGFYDEHWAYNRRSPYVVVLEEAEYRGIRTELQEAWTRVRDSNGGFASKLLTFDVACNERAHDITFNEGCYICINCRKRVTREEVLVIANRQLRGRLREFAC